MKGCKNCKLNPSCTMVWRTSKKDCPHFIQKTNADRIRAMSDEELADFINRCTSGEDALHFCRSLPECDADLEADTLIPLERCSACLLHWIKQPAKEET